MTIRAGIYSRYSSSLQKETSIEDQNAMARRYCEQQGWEVVEVFEDREMSGRHTRRPGFQALLEAARNGEFDVVVVEAVDRLTRRVGDAIGTFERFSFQNIQLVSVQEGPQDFMRILLLGLGAQMFSEKIADHTKRGMQGAVRRGRTHSKAFGYRIREGDEGPNRQIDPDTAPIVARIFEEFASGRSATAIAKGLNADRIPAPNGGTWCGSSLRGNPDRQEGILRNPIYIGIISNCKTTHDHHPETGQRKIKLTPEDAVHNDLADLRIIPQPLWDAVQAELDRRAAATPKAARAAHRAKYLLSGLLTCSCCGAPYVVSSKTGYRCRESNKGACGNKASISRKRIEKRVFGALRSVFQSDELQTAFEQVVKAERKKLSNGSAKTSLKRLKSALRKAEFAQENILKAIKEGAPFAAFKAESESLEVEMADLKQRLADTEARIAQQNAPQPDAKDVFAQALRRMEQLLSDPDYVDEASTYLKMLIKRIVLTPDADARHGMKVTMMLAEDALMPVASGDEDGGKEGLPVDC